MVVVSVMIFFLVVVYKIPSKTLYSVQCVEMLFNPMFLFVVWFSSLLFTDGHVLTLPVVACSFHAQLTTVRYPIFLSGVVAILKRVCSIFLVSTIISPSNGIKSSLHPYLTQLHNLFTYYRIYTSSIWVCFYKRRRAKQFSGTPSSIFDISV